MGVINEEQDFVGGQNEEEIAGVVNWTEEEERKAKRK